SFAGRSFADEPNRECHPERSEGSSADSARGCFAVDAAQHDTGAGGHAMKLRELLRDVPVLAGAADDDLDIAAVTADSRLVVPGALFVAVPGTQQDGAAYIAPARRKGAAAIVGETDDADIRVEDARIALALLAANFYGRPAEKLSLVGVTGTSGKTTTTKMIESIFDALS